MNTVYGGVDFSPVARSNRAVVNILLWCVYVWVVLGLLSLIPGAEFLALKLAFTPNIPEIFYQPWSIFTYIFMHAGFWHLLGNMLWLFFIGTILEDLTGKKYIWKLFIGGGIFGALFFMLFFQLFFAGASPFVSHMVGASAGVSAIIIGTAVFVPQYELFLFGVIRVPLFLIAIVRVVFDIMGSMGFSNQGGFIAHIGGELFGLLFVMHSRGTITIPLVDSIASAVSRMFSKQPKQKPGRNIRVTINNPVRQEPRSKVSQDEVDRILDKINKTGYNSLTQSEKETLFKAGDD